MKTETRDIARSWACDKCGKLLNRGEVWLLEKMDVRAQVFCYDHAPQTAIRLKATLRSER